MVRAAAERKKALCNLSSQARWAKRPFHSEIAKMSIPPNKRMAVGTKAKR